MSTAMSSARPEVAEDKASWLKKAVNYVSVNLACSSNWLIIYKTRRDFSPIILLDVV
jgi:hypothetical protein